MLDSLKKTIIGWAVETPASISTIFKKNKTVTKFCVYYNCFDSFLELTRLQKTEVKKLINRL